MIPDAEMIAVVRGLRIGATDALARGERYYSPNMSPLTWLALLDDIEGKAPRNLPAIIRDNAIDRIEAAADKIEQAAALLQMRDSPICGEAVDSEKPL